MGVANIALKSNSLRQHYLVQVRTAHDFAVSGMISALLEHPGCADKITDYSFPRVGLSLFLQELFAVCPARL